FPSLTPACPVCFSVTAVPRGWAGVWPLSFCIRAHRMTPNNRTGFLCDDRVTCVPASWVCDRVSNCRNGEDEQEQFCGDLPHSLPGYLVFYCSSPRSWVYADQRCNGMNDCGDCSDETWGSAACPPCGQEWWSCSPAHFQFCSCIPRRLCRDGTQHCLDWSDEFLCTA
uniref:Low density lipoprotein receptor class A domain containing 1 n=1 Tax=Taeniopygia guttata TaxID=59729 RepID=A0A674GIP6_TAEGU